MNNKRICITFAWAVGSSKTPISNYLSWKLNLPIFNNDAIRSEVIEDLGMFDNEEHLKRRNSRLEEVIINGNSFICDVSVDREWWKFKEKLISSNYNFFIISLDLSKELLTKLYLSKKYFESLERIDELIWDHDNFLNKYSNDINLHINDKNFINRIQISYNKVREYLDQKNKNNKFSEGKNFDENGDEWG